MANRSIVHVELSANDPAASAKFYSDLFGWESHEVPGSNYWVFSTEENRGGGFNAIGDAGGMDVKPGTVVIYVHSEDIEADLSRAEQLGAQVIMPKMDIGEFGWIGVFRDPTGNLVGVHSDPAQTP